MLNNLSLLSWPLHHRRKLFIPPIHNVPVLAILVVLVAHAMVPSFTTSDLPLVHQPVLLFQVQASPITGHPAPPSPALAFWGLFRHRAPLFNVGTANNLAILLLGAHCLLVMLTSLLIFLACISIKPLTPISTWTLVPPIT
ncbi:unnamed protein product [Prunus armeniaca]|uniref:Uncharacterized protein n=1 Tax=Prunus armeniaca TaxID=36596 RepID=A0A6J5XC12_PRUAR|nr:unnamed protein product [Prunus armeniaca]